MSRGRSNKIVADELTISKDTVKGHMRTILSKLGANDRLDAVMIALPRGILDGQQPNQRSKQTVGCAATGQIFRASRVDSIKGSS